MRVGELYFSNSSALMCVSVDVSIILQCVVSRSPPEWRQQSMVVSSAEVECSADSYLVSNTASSSTYY